MKPLINTSTEGTILKIGYMGYLMPCGVLSIYLPIYLKWKENEINSLKPFISFVIKSFCFINWLVLSILCVRVCAHTHWCIWEYIIYRGIYSPLYLVPSNLGKLPVERALSFNQHIVTESWFLHNTAIEPISLIQNGDEGTSMSGTSGKCVFHPCNISIVW